MAQHIRLSGSWTENMPLLGLEGPPWAAVAGEGLGQVPAAEVPRAASQRWHPFVAPLA